MSGKSFWRVEVWKWQAARGTERKRGERAGLFWRRGGLSVDEGRGRMGSRARGIDAAKGRWARAVCRSAQAGGCSGRVVEEGCDRAEEWRGDREVNKQTEGAGWYALSICREKDRNGAWKGKLYQSWIVQYLGIEMKWNFLRKIKPKKYLNIVQRSCESNEKLIKTNIEKNWQNQSSS